MKYIFNKVIWITGASSGIGEALTYELAKQNVRLIISARRKEELERVKGNCAHGRTSQYTNSTIGSFAGEYASIDSSAMRFVYLGMSTFW